MTQNNSEICLKNSKCHGTIAYVQHHTVLFWIQEHFAEYFQKENSNFENVDVTKFIEGIKGVLESGLYEPIMNIIGIIFFEKVLEIQNQKVSTEECILFFSSCILLSSKMHEDHTLRAKEFYEEGKFKKQNISFEKFLEMERNILKILDYKLNIEFKEIEEFINLNSKFISTKVVSMIWKKCQFCFETRRQ
jgi:hypothetical protein